MDELEFRRRLIVNPQEVAQQSTQDKDNNKDKQPLIDEQLEFEEQLKQTLDIPAPTHLAEKIILKQIKSQPKVLPRFGIHWVYIFSPIAFMLIAIVGLMVHYQVSGVGDAGNRVQNQPTLDLKAAVVEHLYEDSHALDTFKAYSKVDINTVLATMGGKLSDPIGNVSYLSRCIVGKNLGLHMVIQGQSGLVTVLLLPSESIAGKTHFSDDNFMGIMLPSQKGVVVIVSEKKDIQMESPQGPSQQEIIRERVEKNLHWII